LDFSAAPWYSADNPMRWYAVLNPDRTPRPAFVQLRMNNEQNWNTDNTNVTDFHR